MCSANEWRSQQSLDFCKGMVSRLGEGTAVAAVESRLISINRNGCSEPKA